MAIISAGRVLLDRRAAAADRGARGQDLAARSIERARARRRYAGALRGDLDAARRRPHASSTCSPTSARATASSRSTPDLEDVYFHALRSGRAPTPRRRRPEARGDAMLGDHRPLRAPLPAPAAALLRPSPLVSCAARPFGAVTSDAVTIGGAIGNVHRNAPFVIMQLLIVMSDPRHVRHHRLRRPARSSATSSTARHALFFSTPITQAATTWSGRFAGLARRSRCWSSSALGAGDRRRQLHALARAGAARAVPAGAVRSSRCCVLRAAEPALHAARLLRPGRADAQHARDLRRRRGVPRGATSSPASLLRRPREPSRSAACSIRSASPRSSCATALLDRRRAEHAAPCPLDGILPLEPRPLARRRRWPSLGLALLALSIPARAAAAAATQTARREPRRSAVAAPIAARRRRRTSRRLLGRRAAWRSSSHQTRLEVARVCKSIPFLVIARSSGCAQRARRRSSAGRPLRHAVYPVTYLMLGR